MANINKTLKELYYDPKIGFTGADEFHRKLKSRGVIVPLSEVKEWLDKEPTVQISKGSHNKTPASLPIFGRQMNTYNIDLAFLPKWKGFNNGYYVLLITININTRRAHVYASRDKRAPSINKMISQFIEDVKPKVLIHDNGSEFLNRETKRLLESNDIRQILVESGNHNKLGIIDRFTRTLKERLDKVMIHRDKPKWLDVLGDIVDNYNDSYHSGIGMKPNDMTPELEADYIKFKSMVTSKITENYANQGMPLWVRIKNKRNVFTKGSGKLFSHKVYEVEESKFNGRIKVKGREEWIAPVDYLEVNEPVGESERLTGDTRKEAERQVRVKRARQKSGIEFDKPELRRSTRTRKKVEKLDL